MWKTRWAVSIDGRDATSSMNAYLRSITISEKEGDGGDEATLEFDDTAGALFLPRAGARVKISLGGVQKFDGWTEEPEWSFARGAGRSFSVHCTAHDSRGGVKDAQHWHQDGGNLESYLTKAAKAAGLSAVKVAPAFASITRSWWSPDGASFLQMGRRLAEEIGGVFRVRGDTAILAEKGKGTSVSGASLPAVTFDCSAAEVISVRAHPYTGYQSRTKARATWFDRSTGTWKHEDVEVDPIDGAPASTVHGRYPRASSEEASASAKGRKTRAGHEKGGASVATDLTEELITGGSVGAPATLVNARPGVDGTYKISGATRKLDREGGAAGEFELARPEGKAGKDSRKKQTSSGQDSTAYSP